MADEILGEQRADLQVMKQENAVLRSEVADLRSMPAGVSLP